MPQNSVLSIYSPRACLVPVSRRKTYPYKPRRLGVAAWDRPIPDETFSGSAGTPSVAPAEDAWAPSMQPFNHQPAIFPLLFCPSAACQKLLAPDHLSIDGARSFRLCNRV